MLKEADIDRHSRWSDVKRKLDSDPRYKAVESSVQREDWFRDYMVKVCCSAICLQCHFYMKLFSVTHNV